MSVRNHKTKHDVSPSGSDGRYPLYNKFYSFSCNRFFELINNVNVEFINYIPMKMKYKNSITTYNGNYLLIKENWDRHEELNNMTDYFSERVRIRGNFKNCMCPYDYWQKYKTEIEAKSHEIYGELNIKFIRDTMYNSVRFCNNFRVSLAITILKLFNARKWLDISSGWGDRLLAAIGKNVDLYVGVDPNNSLHPCYKKIIETLVKPVDRKKFILINDGFEHADIPKHDYDLVFSSPPFFDLEEYSDSEKDSANAYRTPEKWFNEFLIASINKSYDNLIVGGHLVLYIAESCDTHYINRMLAHTNSLMKYNGSIYYFYEGAYVPRRIFVWEKEK